MVEVARKSGLKKKDTKILLEAFVQAVEQALIEGESVKLMDFGVFAVKDRKARQGRDPRDPQKTFEVPPRKAPIFRAGRSLKERIRES